jgi:F0F1-type ATP synthase assembly protein I
LDEQPKDTKATAPGMEKAASYSRQTALAFELPFTLVGPPILGGILGYFLDHWLHTRPFLMLLLGLLGFVGGLREMLRRLAKSDM